MKVQGTLREYPAGTPSVGVDVVLYREIDDVEIDTVTTDADGRWSYTQNGHPGPWRWEADDGDTVRVSSSQSYGSGGAYATYELVPALRVPGTGIIPGFGDELAVTYDGAGLDLDVATGGAVVQGIPAIWWSAAEHTVATARDASNPKQCYLVLEVTGAGEAEEGKVVLKDVCGAAAASPTLPSLTQTEATYQFPLATFRLPTTASTTLTQVTDARPAAAGTSNPVVSSVVRRTDPTSVATTTSTTGADATSLTTSLTLLDGVTYDLDARCFLVCKIGTAGQTAQLAIYLNGTSNMSDYVANSATDYLGIGNAHTLGSVAGTGAAVNCGVRIKVSGGTMSYHVGYLLVTATPRT
jgi:hypothetical protein